MLPLIIQVKCKLVFRAVKIQREQEICWEREKKYKCTFRLIRGKWESKHLKNWF